MMNLPKIAGGSPLRSEPLRALYTDKIHRLNAAPRTLSVALRPPPVGTSGVPETIIDHTSSSLFYFSTGRPKQPAVIPPIELIDALKLSNQRTNVFSVAYSTLAGENVGYLVSYPKGFDANAAHEVVGLTTAPSERAQAVAYFGIEEKLSALGKADAIAVLPDISIHRATTQSEAYRRMASEIITHEMLPYLASHVKVGAFTAAHVSHATQPYTMTGAQPSSPSTPAFDATPLFEPSKPEVKPFAINPRLAEAESARQANAFTLGTGPTPPAVRANPFEGLAAHDARVLTNLAATRPLLAPAIAQLASARPELFAQVDPVTGQRFADHLEKFAASDLRDSETAGLGEFISRLATHLGLSATGI